MLRKNICDYLEDIERITNRKITNKQKQLVIDYIRNNQFFKVKISTEKMRKKEFNKNRTKIREEWERETGQKWPQYEMDVYDRNGKVVRKKGQYYDAHHIVEMRFGGLDIWYNLFPASYPDEHQNGIHRKGSIASKIFGEN